MKGADTGIETFMAGVSQMTVFRFLYHCKGLCCLHLQVGGIISRYTSAYTWV